MSGGSFDYMYSTIENTYVGYMEDEELNEMMLDLCKLLYELEWYVSGDTSQEDYLQSVKLFKSKWLKGEPQA